IVTNIDPMLGKNNLYYVEYRQLLGLDSSLSLFPTATTGVLIHQASSTRADSSFLLDSHAGTPGFDDAALQVGESFTDAVSGVSITLMAADANHASVKVTMGGDLCTPRNPTVTIAPSGFSGTPGTVATYTATITNNDATGCGNTSFTLSNSVPADWVGSLDKTAITLAPGTSTTAKFLVTSSTTAGGGRYRLFVAAKADVSGLSGAGATNYDILAPFSITVSPTSVSAPQGGSAVANVSSIVSAPFSNSIQLSVSGQPA